jgi:A/G-specific adenine glycosylase
MLQQTRVAAALPYFERFLARFPTLDALAAAPEERVLASWSGLGYYGRARALRRGAQAVVERHAGRLPRDVRALRELPGIGPYTAGAIASLAFGQAEPVVDGNVRRVLARLFAVDGRRTGPASETRRLWDLARRLVAGPRPGTLNQALMELGAVVCLPRQPSCAVCPVAPDCAARAANAVARYPSPKARLATVERDVAVAVVERGGRVLLERPGATSPFRGTWDLPAAMPDADRLRESLRDRHGLHVEVGQPIARLTHGILQSVLRLEVHPCRLLAPAAATGDLRWIAPAAIGDVAVSGATRKVLEIRRRDPRPAPAIRRVGSAAGTSRARRAPGARPRTPDRRRPSTRETR